MRVTPAGRRATYSPTRATMSVAAPRVGPVIEGVAVAVTRMLSDLLRPEHADAVRAERQSPAKQRPDGPEEQDPSHRDAGDQPQHDHEPVHARVAEQVPVETPPDHAHRIEARRLWQWWRERRKIPGQNLEVAERLGLVGKAHALGELADGQPPIAVVLA